MPKKAKKTAVENSDYEDGGLTNEDIQQLGALAKGGINAVKGGFGAIKSFINPNMVDKKQVELAKLQAEVAALEQKQTLDEKIAELRKKKASLQNKSTENEDENVAFADA
jgi:hypothetical protein